MDGVEQIRQQFSIFLLIIAIRVHVSYFICCTALKTFNGSGNSCTFTICLEYLRAPNANLFLPASIDILSLLNFTSGKT